MRRLAWLLLVLVVAWVVGCGKSEEKPARPRLVEAPVEPPPAIRSDAMRRDWEGPDPSFDRAFVEFSRAREKTREAGAYSFERGKRGSVEVWRRVAQVSGDAFSQLRDGALVTQVQARLAADETTRGLDVSIDAEDHTVELAGEVRSILEAARAVRLVLSTPGVDRVVARLTYPR
jgi:hypothetical protein